MSTQKNSKDLNTSNKEKQDLIPEKTRKEFESIAEANARHQNRILKVLADLDAGKPVTETQRAQWLQSACISSRDTLYGPEPSEAVHFEVKAAIEQAYDQDIINEIFTVYDAAQSSPDAMRAVKVILYLLGLSDADPIKG